MRQVCQIVHDIWISGDGCPKTFNAICYQFKTEVLPVYHKYRKGDFKGEGGVSKKKKKKKKDTSPPPPPSRKSERLGSTSSVEKDCDPTPPTPTSTSTSSRPATRTETGPSRYSVWLKDHGDKLFDVFSSKTLEKVLEEGGAFDSCFYDDQKEPSERNLVIETMRVSKDYYDYWREIEATKARKFFRTLSALGIDPTLCNRDTTDPDINDNFDAPHKSPFKPPLEDRNPSMSRVRMTTVTRSTAVRCLSEQLENVITLPTSIATKIDAGTQTKEIFLEDLNECTMPKISTRKKTTRRTRGQSSYTISPAYLQSGALMMSVATMSASQAVIAMKIHDETVYKQKRLLPLALNKKYQRNLNLFKRYQDIILKTASI